MDYWKSKVLPKMRLVFVKTGGKKAAAAAELLKSFDESKEGINAVFEEKKADLQPKVLEIYESVPAPVKILIKERKKTSAIKKNSAAITKLFEDLAKIEFPGAKQVSEGITAVGPALLSGPIFATFDKVSSLLPAVADAEEQSPPKEEAPAAATEEEKKDESAADAAATEEKKEEAAAGEKKEGELVAEEKKEEATVEEAAAPSAAEPASAEETTGSATPAEAAPEAAAAVAPAEPESAPPAKADEAPKAV